MLGTGLPHMCSFRRPAPQLVAKRPSAAAHAVELRANPYSGWRHGAIAPNISATHALGEQHDECNC